MLGSKRFSPLLVSSLFLGASTAAWAGSASQLDINQILQPLPQTSKAQQKQNIQADGKFDGTTYVSTPSMTEDSSKTYLPHGDKAARVAKSKDEEKLGKQTSEGKEKKKIAHGLGMPGLPKLKLPGGHKKEEQKVQPLMADLAPAPKHSESVFEKASKPNKPKSLDGGFGDKIGDSSKGFGESIANGAKSSGNFFVKGARAIGNGIKSGTDTVGSKVASVSPFGHNDKKSEPSKIDKQNNVQSEQIASKKLKSTSFGHSGSDSMENWDPNRKTATAPAQELGGQFNAGSPHTVATAKQQQQSKNSFFGKTMNKIPFLGHDKQVAARPQTQSQKQKSRFF